MEYKGYNISDLQSLLAYDTLQVMNEILQELKGIREILTPAENPQEAIPEAKPDVEIKSVEEKQEVQKEMKLEVKKPTTKKPVKRKTTAKKKKTKAVKKDGV